MLGSLLLASSLAFTTADARIARDAADGLVRNCTPRDAATAGAIAASYWILDEASRMGADVRRDVFRAETPKGERAFINLRAEFVYDPSAEWVVLVSHYDTKPGTGCPGANDGASTTGLLVSLVNVLSRWRDYRCNVMLLWTDGEECMESYSDNDGLWGSRHAVEMIEARHLKVRAVVCLDMLGDRDLDMTIPRNGSPALTKIACVAAKKAGVGLREIPELVRDDHSPFLAAGYRAIDIIDFSYGSAPGLNDYWHTPEDTLDKISVDSLFAAGSLVTGMLEVLLK